MTAWIAVAAGVLALIGWVIARTTREASREAARPRRKPSSRSGSSSKRSGRDAIRTRPKRSSSSKGDDVPRVSHEGDDAEITQVTASPGDPEPPSSDPRPDTSTIAVIYEKEAEVEEITYPTARILVSADGQSDQGQVRKRNEDSLLVLPERSVFAVADGMGGYKGGNVASSMAVEVLRNSFERNVFEGTTQCDTYVPRRGREMACAIQMANQAILAKAKTDAELAQMGTTVVAARFSPNKQRVYIGHVGDSRCYRLRGETLRQLTTDHTMSELGMKGPGSEHLFQAVGIRQKILIDIIVDKPRADDIYLLCSDGLSKMADDEQIRDILLTEPDVEAAVYSLIELANDQGGKDNITVVVVKVLERAPSLLPSPS